MRVRRLKGTQVRFPAHGCLSLFLPLWVQVRQQFIDIVCFRLVCCRTWVIRIKCRFQPATVRVIFHELPEPGFQFLLELFQFFCAHSVGDNAKHDAMSPSAARAMTEVPLAAGTDTGAKLCRLARVPARGVRCARQTEGGRHELCLPPLLTLIMNSSAQQRHAILVHVVIFDN